MKTFAVGSAREFAVKCSFARFTHVIAVGGDGTLNEVVDGLMSTGNDADALPIVSILPCGTGNDFARTIGIENNIDALLERTKNGLVSYVDVGTVEFRDELRHPSQRFFINVMDIGLGGRIAQKVNAYRRKPWSFLAYQRAILSTLPFYRKVNLEVSAGKLHHSGPTLSVVVANGKWFGNGLGIAPHAQTNDGQLALVILGRVGMLEYLLNLPKILRGKIIHHNEVIYGHSVFVDIDGDSTAIELDGEYVGQSPCSVRVCARAIRFLH